MRRFSVIATTLLMIFATLPVAADERAGTAPGRVTIVRDEYGVPHLYAAETRALFYGVGYVQGQDRLWQAEILRRSARGTLAELLGEGAVAGDVQARSLFGPPERLDALYASAPSELRVILDAYVEGLNAWIGEAEASGGLPLEFGGAAPALWSPTDSLAVFLLLQSQFGWSGSDELAFASEFAQLTERLGPSEGALAFADTHWLDDPDATTSVPATGAIGRPGRRSTTPAAGLDSSVVAAAEAVERAQLDITESRRLAGLRVDEPASNAAVVSPGLSADGSALLLGGPQMGYTAPQINHEIGLHGAGFDVTGMTIAGGPLVPIGVGHGYAWTLTSGGTDNTDIYAETLNADGQYLFEGTWHDLECRAEDFGVAGAEAVTETLCSTAHGPIIFADGATAYTLKSVTVGSEATSLMAWMDLSRARGIRDFETSLAEMAPNFNVLYADASGNIAYWHVGHIPIRADGTNPFFPLSGTGDAEWQGIVPFNEMPHARNPEQGWLASWNNKPEPGWANSSADFWMWGGAHRVNTFAGELSQVGPGSATIETLEELNRTGGWTTDTPTGQASSVFVSTYVDEMLSAVDTSADPRLADVVDAMAQWDRLQVDLDGDGTYDRPWGSVFNAWWFGLSDRVFGDELGGITNRFVLGNLVDRVLKGSDAGLPLQLDYLDGETVGEVVTGSLVSALDSLTAEYGTADLAAWSQPISVINWSPIGAGTVPDTIWMNRGTYNQLVHLGSRHGGLWAQNVISPGQSGDVRSPHFADQLELYATWTYKPMHLTRRDVRAYAESVVTLEVP